MRSTFLAASAVALLMTVGVAGRIGARPQAGSGGTARSGPYQAPTKMPHFQDARISESSGIADSRRNPGILWTHNDSGDKPIVYGVDRQGNTASAFLVRSAQARDWEDMAYGPGPGGRAGHFLYLGDIGDNDRRRTDCVVYRLPEPRITAQSGTRGNPAPPPSPTPPPTVRHAVRYPDGPHDAEALLVHPKTGTIYIVTKENNGVAGVYRFPAQTSKRAQVLVKVGTVAIQGEEHPFPNRITGGDISPDGRKVVLCTYAAAYEMALPTGARSFEAIWKTRPVRIELPPMPQGEAICYTADGKSLLVTSEQTPAAVYRLDAAR